MLGSQNVGCGDLDAECLLDLTDKRARIALDHDDRTRASPDPQMAADRRPALQTLIAIAGDHVWESIVQGAAPAEREEELPEVRRRCQAVQDARELFPRESTHSAKRSPGGRESRRQRS